MNAYWVNPLTAEMVEELGGGEAFAFAGMYATFISLGFIGRFLAYIRSTFNADLPEDVDRSKNPSDNVLSDPYLMAVLAAAAMAAMGRPVVL